MTTVTKVRINRNRTLPRDQLRARIYDAALGLFRREGYDATTVDTIAKAAGVAKGTVFNFFPAKGAILRAHYEKLDAQFGLAIAAMSPRSPRAALARCFGRAEGLLRNEGTVAEAILREIAIDATMQRAGRTAGERDRARLADYFRVCRRRGTIAREVDPGVLGHVVADLWSASAQDWIRSGRHFSLQRRLAAKLDVLFTGFAAKRKRRR